MKIAIQLLSTLQSTSTKAGPSFENGAEFHGFLEAAAAATVSGSKGASQVVGKQQTSASKPQASDNKKKLAAPESADAGVPTAEVGALQPPLLDARNQFANSLPSNNDLSTTSSALMLSDSSGKVGLAGVVAVLPSSQDSISAVGQPATKTSSTGHTEKQTPDTLTNYPASLSAAPELPATNATAQLVSSFLPLPSGDLTTPATAIQKHETSPSAVAAPVRETSVLPTAAVAPMPPSLSADVKTLPALSHAIPTDVPKATISTSFIATNPVIMAEPAPHSVAPKAAVVDQTANVLKAADLFNTSSTASAVDSTLLAAQQSAAAITQSVVAPVLQPSLSVVYGLQATSAGMATQASIAGKVADSAKGAAEPQPVSPLKTKPVPAIPSPGSRFADNSDVTTQTESLSVTTAAVMPKGSDASASAIHSVKAPQGSFDTGSLQQVAPAGPVDSGSHTPQLTPGMSAPAGNVVQTLPAHAASDSQAMQGVTSAQLIQSVRSSEMKLGMQSAEFGNISISTSLNRQTLSAQILFDHSELGRALAVHLPAIEEKLGSAYGVQAKVELRDSNNPSSANDSGYSNSGQQSREQRQSQGGGSAAFQGTMLERTAVRSIVTSASMTASASRLDIRI